MGVVCPFYGKSHHKSVLIVYNLSENKLCGDAVLLWCTVGILFKPHWANVF